MENRQIFSPYQGGGDLTNSIIFFWYFVMYAIIKKNFYRNFNFKSKQFHFVIFIRKNTRNLIWMKKKLSPQKIFEAHLARESSENLGSAREPTFKMAKNSARIGFYLKLLWFSLPKISLIFLTENLFDFSYLKFIFSRRMLKNKKSFIRMRCFKSFLNFCFGEQQQKKWKDLIHFPFVSSIAYLLFW